MPSGIFAGCPSLGHLSWARKKGDKAKASPCQVVHDPCFISAPQFTGPRRHALMLPVITLFCCRSTSPRHVNRVRPPAPSVYECHVASAGRVCLFFVVVILICAALLCASFASELPGAGERRNQIVLPQPRTSPELKASIKPFPAGRVYTISNMPKEMKL